jgi:tetratricopeptide (TPR) repeat protein
MVRVALVLAGFLLCASTAAWAGGVADADAGLARLNAGDAPAAVELFTRAIQSKELSPERLALTYHHRGMAFHREGQSGRAILDYTTALWNQNLPRGFKPRTLNNRGLAFESINDFGSAMRDYNLALRMNDDYAEAYCSRGNLHRKFGRHDAAIADYDMALRNGHPQPKYVFLWQGMSLEGLGKRREAMDAFRRALSIDPEFKLAKAHLERLEASHGLDSMLGRRKVAKTPVNAPVVLTASPTLQTTAVSSELNTPPWTPPGTKAPAIVKQAPPSPPAPAPAASDHGLVLRPAFDDQSKIQAVPAVLNSKSGVVATVPGTPAAPVTTTPAIAPVPQQPKIAANGEGGSDVEFALQLGSFKSEALAKTGWQSVLEVAGDLVGGLSHVVEPVVLPERGRVYRLFAEAMPDRDAALGLCRTLRDKGIPCIVVRR